ncbi:hypothetical protein AC579_9503 [Pseudocercospora musae]|uniref:Extracellular membrane protein CFEM domain-containing protein n=1 Tax=Pseudocercospora musae TaxID=113226 RepID=A0A139IMG6_9PEZI|nr:hypothetical protein AC579_9503 [Pseudocercospora musae]
MRVITITAAALSLIAAVFAPGVDADKRECALCLEEAGGLSGCEAEAHGIPTMTCLCNYPGYSTYKLCNSRCEGPDGWPEKAPSHVCKNYTTNASTEIFTTSSTTIDGKKVVDRAALATEVSNLSSLRGPWRNKWMFPHWWGGASRGGHRISKGGNMEICGVDGASCAYATHQDLPDTAPSRSQGGHTLPNTAAELGSQHLAATAQSHPTIEAILSGHQAAPSTQAHPTIEATLSGHYAAAQGMPTITTSIGEPLVSGVPLGTGPLITGTLTFAASPNDTIEARSKVPQGPYNFCGVPGGACPNREGNILPTSHPIPTILSKRHDGHNDTAARWSNDTETDFNSTSRPGGQPPTDAAAESKGRKLDSNKEKVWLIAILAAGVVAFAQIKRTL